MKGRILAIAGLLTIFAAGPALAQIDGSPHDLASGDAALEDNNEICVYCHTPHAARTDVEAPLWNKGSTGQTYTTYDSTTIDGDVLAVGSVSIACLTCHDGTQAVDNVVNAPGSGGYVPAGANMFATGNSFVTGVAALGNDLQNDHPIGIQYGGFDPGAGQIDPDFHNLAGRLEDNGGTGAAKRWWVDTEATANATRNKTDMILYTRDNGGNSEPFVECASCHDPHEGGATSPDVNFMRISNENSAVCLACHTK